MHAPFDTLAFTQRLMKVIAVSLCVELLLVVIALGTTALASRTNARGLGWLVLLLWCTVVTLGVLLCRRWSATMAMTVVALIWIVVAERTYTYIGAHALGWIGLDKP